MSGKMVHIGIAFRRQKYAGVELYGTGLRKKTFGSARDADNFHQHLMDAIVECIRKGHRAMWSSSVDHYVMDTKPWGWSENGIVGEYVFRVKDKKKPWHQFTKPCAGKKGRRPMWIQSEGKMVVIQGDDKFTFTALHGEASKPIKVSAQCVEDVFDMLKGARVKRTLEIGKD